jgi:1-acyl-sn-glycerol-3-phosphate acyltransferase
MNIRRAVVNSILKRILDTLCEIDSAEFMNALSNTGTMIIAFNHINFLEVPILVTHSYPLSVTGLVKDTTWKNPFIGFLADTYSAIPLNRQGAYLGAFEQAKKLMDKGFFICIAPEGTRSGNGVLGKGKGGIVQLALITGAPVLPVVHFGGEKIWENMKHFKRTPVRFKVGRPFHLKCAGEVDKAMRERMLEELMGRMAALLPEERRGIYAEQASRECEYLEFL